MSHVPHELPEMLGAEPAAISAKSAEDAHFAKEADEYHRLNRAIHRAETSVEPVEDMAEFEMRKTRMRLKDDLYAMLCRAET